MHFTPIDLAAWSCGERFLHFSPTAPPPPFPPPPPPFHWLRGLLRAAGIRFFPAYVWLVTKSLNRQVEFKVAEREGVTGYYDALTPLYASFHEDDHTFSLMWTEYSDDFRRFYQAYLDNQRAFGAVHGVLSQPQTPPANAYTVSCIPWVGFTHFAVHSYENKPYYFPSVEAGRFSEENGRVLMPLSITCHHATTDGYHIKRFLDSLQEDMAAFGQFL